MTKEDYKEKVEELRQEIELEDDAIKRSRASRHSKTKTKKRKNPMMTLLVFVFILIPLGILFYVWFLFEPEVPAEVAKDTDDKGIVVEIQNQEPKDANASIVADDKTENSEENKEQPKPTAAEDEAAKQAAAAEVAKKAEEAEIKKAEEAQKAAAAKLEEQKRQAAEQAKAAEEKAKAEQAAASSKSHTVQSTDNLYRIALKYYGNGSPEYVNKIKQANGLSSDSISNGQVLIIP